MKTRMISCIIIGIGLVCGLLFVMKQPVKGEVAASPPPADICVNPGGTPPCYASIQDAIDAASAGQVITVATGVYHEHIVIDKNLQLHGLGQAKAISTTIDGGHTGSTATINIEWGVDASTMISGFIVTGGGTGISSTSTNKGGGIAMWHASPRIINTWVDHCTASNGGGVYVNAGSPTFENVPVWNSQASQRGGGYNIENDANVNIIGDPFLALHPFQDSVGSIWFNRAGWEGGGLFIADSAVNLNGLRIWWNASDMTGGGISVFSSTLPTHIIGNLIWWNGAKTGGYAGGGIHAYDAHNLDIIFNDISENGTYGKGAGILFNQSGGRLSFNFIRNNRASGNTAYYAGIDIIGISTTLTVNNNWFEGNVSSKQGGAISIEDEAAPRIDSNVIVSNSIGYGLGAGIIVQSAGPAEIVNNIIARNTITTASGRGSGITIVDSPVHFVNNTVADNDFGGVYLIDAEDAILLNNIIAGNGGYGLEASSSITYPIVADYNDLIGNTSGNYYLIDPGGNDQNLNPKFLMTGDMFNYYHVEPDSLVKDLGTKDWAPIYDIDGLFRGLGIWMGVDEWGFQSNLFLPVVMR